MRALVKILLPVILLFTLSLNGQSVSSSLPSKRSASEKYLFYQHGAVVSVVGDNGINQGAPEWGPYEYSNILDSLRKRGFNVISEIRKQGLHDSVFVNQTVKQIDTLFRSGVPPENIILVGASSGWNIVLRVSDKLKNPKMHYVIMGGCWAETHKDFSDVDLYGHFLSIFETSDPHQSCMAVFTERKHLSSLKEIKLNTGLSHGFFYKGRRVWIDPIVEWFSHKIPR